MHFFLKKDLQKLLEYDIITLVECIQTFNKRIRRGIEVVITGLTRNHVRI